ncbi:Ppx/GppA family phosphatase [Phocaeicola coprocola]|uniref:Ppx/GppA phosphatase family protein n=1 Tax=Phocaeicola coprocola TaxID=310298 RepID=UPI001C384C98|nr:Ppx/GppA family phosphatase [Phocaeicola coprocola]MBV3866305.1 Ppx/GppA family phosphatase [Phocaeicola coprocola]MBV4007528.1 Ppx/GppA family phosphatase [Phocaeicola coprocola]MBV4031955.1 Ppx/GppA family phosphatase [Phocaeicola coprocola]MBV4038499.1 Ppx/GppA family phosphatase [Phocaeicola coprocola]MBV4060174.1 Ppx/GppA family phosphatase [Phocaeicola coprocola]
MNENETRKTNYAAIDIGSNAVRLLIKEIKEEQGKAHFSKVLMLRVPLRLGFDVFDIGKISEKKEKNMIRLMKAFRHLMKIYDVKHCRACATSAMRDAKNGMDIIKQIEKKTGVHIDIIDGQEEAKIIYNNHVEHMEDQKGNYMYVDVGGGSTEINLLSEGQLVCSRSYNIGTVRMLNNAVKDSEWERLKNDLAELAKSYPQTNIIGSGGNINKLYRLADKKNKKKMTMQVSVLQELHTRLKALSLEERMEQFGMKPDRADVIIPASEIFLTIANIIGASYIHVPVIGLSDGIIDELYLQNKNNQPA